jgi:hypothetical protein
LYDIKAEAAEGDIMAASMQLEAMLKLQEPLAPVPLNAEEEWERNMAEPIYFQVMLLNARC